LNNHLISIEITSEFDGKEIALSTRPPACTEPLESQSGVKMTAPRSPYRREGSSDSGDSKKVPASDGLNDAQREFARLLGRLLAKKWIQEQAVPEPTEDSENGAGDGSK
jgi:hypothetical protein